MKFRNDNPTPCPASGIGRGLLIAYCLLLTALLAFPSCDNAQASPYKEMYEQQVVVNKQQLIVNDSLKAEINLLDQRLDQIYNSSIQKIDSLKNVVSQKNILIAQQDSIITNAQRDFLVFLDSLEYDLENLNEKALQNLINIQKR